MTSFSVVRLASLCIGRGMGVAMAVKRIWSAKFLEGVKR